MKDVLPLKADKMGTFKRVQATFKFKYKIVYSMHFRLNLFLIIVYEYLMNYYSDTYSKHRFISNNFPYMLLKYRKELPTIKLLKEKSVILPIIRGVSPT